MIMKALSTSIVLVVTVIVVLVVALVVLRIFSGGIGQVNTITNFRNNCITQCQITCKMGTLPPTWEAEVNVQGYTTPQSCGSVTSINDCTGCGGSSTTGTTTCPHASSTATPCDTACPYCDKTKDCRTPCQ